MALAGRRKSPPANTASAVLPGAGLAAEHAAFNRKALMSRLSRLVLACAALVSVGASQALTINYTFLPGTSEQAQQAIRLAGAEWSSVITTNLTVDLNFETGLKMDSSVFGTTRSLMVGAYYDDVRKLLVKGSTSAADAVAVAHLPKETGFTYDRLINRTSDNPAGAGSATPYVDHAITTLRLSSANARALGMALLTNPSPGCAANCDARIDINSLYQSQYDYDPSDGISPGSYDFVGIVAHEIGHALGFFSGVDYLDAAGSPRTAGQFAYVNTLDLFRYSSLSAASHVIDFTADNRSKYFSLDGGATMGPAFSTGEFYGDGAQASHWKDGGDIGLMQPYVLPGVALHLTSADLQAMDAIGWTVSAVPEPASAALFALGLCGIAGLRGRRGRAG